MARGITDEALVAFSTGSSRNSQVAVSIYFGGTSTGPDCSDADVIFAGLLGTLVNKDTGVVGQHWGWEEKQFLSSKAAKIKPKAAAGPKPKAGQKRHDKSDGEWVGDEGEGDESEDEENEDEDASPPPPPPTKILASTSKGKRIEIPEHRRKSIPPPPPPATIEPMSQEQVVDPKGKGKAIQRTAPKATLLPPPPVKPTSQERKSKHVADPKGLRKATPSAVPKASDPPSNKPQTSRSASRRQQDPMGVDETETEDQHPSPPSYKGDGGVMLYDGFIDVLKQSRGTINQSREEWFADVCRQAKEFAGLD